MASTRQPAIKAYAFDLDGTLYIGSSLLPGALELLDQLDRFGLPYLYATNNSSLASSEYAAKLRNLGLPHGERLLTANDTMIRTLRERSISRIHLLASPEVAEDYTAAGIEWASPTPEAVVLTYDKTFTYDKAQRAIAWLHRGLPFFATNPDLVCPHPTGPIPDCGSLAAMLETATGRTPDYTGKPSAVYAATILARLDVPAAEIAFVGDRLYTDIRLARDHGMFGIATLTGECRRVDLTDTAFAPDLVVDDMTALVPWVESTIG